MKNNKFLLLLVLLFLAFPSQAYRSCQNVFDPYYGVYRTQCTAGVSFSDFQVYAYQNQYQDQWCWAASISMVFAHAGHSVSQQRIVEEAYGGVVNLPAQGWQLAQNLNKSWIDDNTEEFISSLTGLYDVTRGVVGITDAQIVNELANGNPLIIGSNGHAMVLTEVSYYANSWGGIEGYVYAGVFDPWPGRGARLLSAAEFTRADLGIGGTMQFLASVSITSENSGDIGNRPPIEELSGQTSSGSSDSGGGISLYLLWLLISIGLIRKPKSRSPR